MTARPALALAAAAVVTAAQPRVCAAQLEAALDAGASYVKYDGFLGSGAASLTPTVTYRTARASLGGRASVLVFESGNTSLMGLLTGGAYSPPLGPARLEAVGEAGASAYSTFARFAHSIGAVRAHVLGARQGVWVGPFLGRIALGARGRNVAGVGAGVWSRLRPGALSLTYTRAGVGDTAYSDIEARLRTRPGRFDVEASFGARFASRGGGRGAYGDLSATARLSERFALVAAAGRYPSDPMRGSIPGEFVTLSLRLAPRPAASRTAVVQPLSWRLTDALSREAAAIGGGMRMVIERVEDLHVLTVHATRATRVEVMGDFTEWQPVVMARVEAGRFEFAIRLPSGMHRFNVRLDGGPWRVPPGVDVADDEFGGEVGVVVVP